MKRDFVKATGIVLVILAAALTLNAQTFEKVLNFNGTNGANPYVGLTQGPDGSLYGTTIDGGAYGSGNVFKITSSGKLVSLYDFCAQANCPDGQYPDTVLALGTDGNFYGTTQNGGTSGGYGTVFRITSGGVLTRLHSFDLADGVAPYGSMVLASNGAFYGTTNVGGAFGGGNVFKITPGAALTVLYSFCSQANCADGQYPVGPLIQGSDGNIYGTTHAGGSTACTDGCGTIFKMSLAGNLTTLHSFDSTNGDYPYGGVVEATNGIFYGTTGGGGTGAVGTVFRMTANGKVSTLYNFTVGYGATPYSVIVGTDGNLYGTTSVGGFGRGTIFELTPSGTETTLHYFSGHEGADIYGGLLQDTNGSFYGTAYFGGADNDGTVFSEATGLGPFVTFVQPAGKTGTTVEILGQGFTGTSNVSFNGVPASFTVRADTFLTAAIPTGATMGYVTVTTPSGTLQSNVPFRVIR